MLHLLYGPAASGKTDLLMGRIRTAVAARTPGQVLLVPEQYSHEAERALCAACGGVRPRPLMAPWPQRLKETIDVCHATIPCVDDPFLSACHSAPAARLAGSGRVGGMQHPGGVRTARTARACPLQASLGRHGGGRLAARAGGPNRR